MTTEITVEQVVGLYSQLQSERKVAEHLGVGKSTVHRRLAEASRRGLLLDHKVAMPGYVVQSVASKENGIWVKQVPEPGPEFQMPPGLKLKGVTALLDAEGRIKHQHVLAREDTDRTLEILRAAVDELKKDLPRAEPVSIPMFGNVDLLNQFTVTDLHFGMLAWGEETRDADYDLKIAEKLLLDWFKVAIALAPAADTAVFAQLGDLMHHDSHEAVTPTNRNLLDADSRLQKVVRVVIRTIRQVIQMLLQRHRHVHIVMASGNHDRASSVWLRELLAMHYENEPRITVDSSPDEYYCYEWGNTALFYHHGHKRAVDKVDNVFASKFRKLFGRCAQSYGHVGHRHSDVVPASNLMKVEQHRTLAPRDAYANSGGWLSDRDAKVITYHKEFGDLGRHIISAQMATLLAEGMS